MDSRLRGNDKDMHHSIRWDDNRTSLFLLAYVPYVFV